MCTRTLRRRTHHKFPVVTADSDRTRRTRLQDRDTKTKHDQMLTAEQKHHYRNSPLTETDFHFTSYIYALLIKCRMVELGVISSQAYLLDFFFH